MLTYKDVPYRRWGQDGKGLLPTKEGARVMKIALDAHQKGSAVTVTQSEPLTPAPKIGAKFIPELHGKTYDTISVTIEE